MKEERSLTLDLSVVLIYLWAYLVSFGQPWPRLSRPRIILCKLWLGTVSSCSTIPLPSNRTPQRRTSPLASLICTRKVTF